MALGAPLAVDISTPGLYDDNDELTPSTIAAGSGTIYPTGFDQRQFTIEAEDFLIEQVDKRTVVPPLRGHGPRRPGSDHHSSGARAAAARRRGLHPGLLEATAPLRFLGRLRAFRQLRGGVRARCLHRQPHPPPTAQHRRRRNEDLGRHATAALLNSTHPDVDFAFTSAEDISVFQAAFDTRGTAIEATKNLFDKANNGPGGCGLS